MLTSVGIAATAFYIIKPAVASIAPMPPPGVPSYCQSSCQKLQNSFTNNNLNKCPSIGVPRCLCTVFIATDLEECLQCFVSIGTITQSNVVDNLNNFITKCAQNGFPILKASTSGSSSLSGNGGASTTSSSLPVTTSSNATDLNTSDSSNTLPSNTGSIVLPIPTTNFTSAASKKMSISTFGVMIPFSVLSLLSY